MGNTCIKKAGKFISTILVLSLSLTLLPSVALAAPKQATSVSFSDLKSSHWAYSAIDKLVGKGIISGYGDNTFKPESNISRAEFAKLVCLADNVPTPSVSKSSFKDVNNSHWALKYIEAAKSSGILSGYPNNTFKPNSPVSRSEVAVMVVKAGKFSIDKTGTPPNDLSSSHWDYNYIMTAVNKKIVSGYPNGTFQPEKATTRAEASSIVLKSLVEVLGEQAPNPDLPTIKITSPTDKDEYSTTNDTISLSGTAADNESVSKVTWTNSTGGQGTANGTTSWSVSSITLKDGVNNVTVTVADNKGNTASDILKVSNALASNGGGGGGSGGGSSNGTISGTVEYQGTSNVIPGVTVEINNGSSTVDSTTT